MWIRCRLKPLVSIGTRVRYGSDLSNCNNVVIAAATRTPIGKMSGQLATLTAPQLAALTIELLMKQTAMPAKQLDAAILASRCTAGMGQAPARQASMAANLPKTVCSNTIVGDGLKAIVAGMQMIELNLATAVIAGSMDSSSNVPFYLQRGKTPYGGVSLQDGLIVDAVPDEEALPFDRSCSQIATHTSTEGLEITPVRVQQQRQARKVPAIVTADDASALGYCDNAASLLLISTAAAENLHIKPLARVISYAQAANVKELLACGELQKSKEICNWMTSPSIWQELKQLGVADAQQQQISLPTNNGAIMLTQLVHALQPEQVGCVIAGGVGGDTDAVVLLVEKLAVPNMGGANGRLPLFTLYTKDPCPLCDMLLDELAEQFAAPTDYVVEKVFITEKENVRYLRAYRFDIPVLFLNGQFLCMYKLNVDTLRRRLDDLSK